MTQKHSVSIEYTFGFTYHPQAWCTCGWVGPTRGMTLRARLDANKHWRTTNSFSG